jgi:hypothetical protein
MSEDTPVAAVDPPHEAIVPEDPVGSRPIAGRPRRFLLLAVAALAVVAAVVAVGAVLRTNDTHAPQYSLEQMANAARNRDWDGVQKYMDVDAVASAFVDVAISTAFGDDTSRSGAVGAGMKPKAIQQIKDSLKRSVENATSTESGDLSGVLFVDKPKAVTYITKDEALVTVEVPLSAGGTRDIGLRMKWADDHWRIAAFDNAAELLDLPF